MKNQELINLAAAAHRRRCTSVVCSCYVASRNSDSKEEEISRSKAAGLFVDESDGCAPLKSNLKKSASISRGVMMRKVSWSDAHGKDIAHVQEFQPR